MYKYHFIEKIIVVKSGAKLFHRFCDVLKKFSISAYFPLVEYQGRTFEPSAYNIINTENVVTESGHLTRKPPDTSHCSVDVLKRVADRPQVSALFPRDVVLLGSLA